MVNGIENYGSTDLYKDPLDFWSLKLLGFLRKNYGEEFWNENT